MRLQSVPLVAPTVTLLVCIALANRAGHCSIPLCLALGGLGCALGNRLGRLVVAVALGGLCGWLQVGSHASADLAIIPERPVVLAGSTIGPWARSRFGWSVPFKSRYFRQGNDIVRWTKKVFVFVGATDEQLPVGPIKAKGYLKQSPAAGSSSGHSSRPWLLSAKSTRFITPDTRRPRSGGTSISARLRTRIDQQFDSFEQTRPGIVMARALMLGDTSQVPKKWLRGLRRSGLAHLLAVSGLHAGILVGFVFVLSFKLPFTLRLLLGLATILFYLTIVGPRPGLVRSSGMVILACLSICVDRPPQAGNILAFIAGLLAVSQAELVDHLGFQLTMSATGGIVYLSPYFIRRWRLIPMKVRTPVAVGVSAQLGCLPWLLPYSNIMTPFAPVFNLVAVPWTGVALVFTYSWFLTSLASRWLGLKLLILLDWFCWPFAWQADLNPAIFRVYPTNLSFEVAGLIAVCAGSALLHPRIGLPVAVALGLLVSLKHDPHHNYPTFGMLDVGQGESLLVQDGSLAVLVDGGGLGNRDMATNVLLPALARRGIRRLSAVALTHSDFDHCGGLADIVSYLPVDEVWITPGGADSACAFELISSPWVRLRVAWAGSRIEVGRWSLTSLHPLPGSRSGGNNQSLVLLAEAFNRKILLTGDIEAAGERSLIERYGALGLRADVLKVAHHGSNSSSSSQFLGVVRPRIALISAGSKNRYGHPSSGVLDRLAAHGIGVLRTDQLGDIDVMLLSKDRSKIRSSGHRP